jgi:hypothetical protein
MPKGKIEVAPVGLSQPQRGQSIGRADARQPALSLSLGHMADRGLASRGVPIQPTRIRPIEELSSETPSLEASCVITTSTAAKLPLELLLDAEAEQSLEEWIDETLGELPGQLLRRARERTTHDVSLSEPYLLGEPARELLDRSGCVKRVQGRRGARVSAELLAIFGTLFSGGSLFWRPSFSAGVAPQGPGPLRVALLGLLLGASAACRSGDLSEPAPVAAPPPVAAAGAPAARPRGVKASERERPKASAPWRIPVGPTLLIEPGKGFGPIRFGAHVDTIERLIGEPCEEKREEAGRVLCRYSAQAVDFVLQNGGVTEMRAHRLGRPFKPEPKLDYGIFNGRFPQGVAFGMLPGAARELLGPPQATRAVTEANPNNTVEVYEYDGFSLEFDQATPQSVVLGGVILRAPKP